MSKSNKIILSAASHLVWFYPLAHIVERGKWTEPKATSPGDNKRKQGILSSIYLEWFTGWVGVQVLTGSVLSRQGELWGNALCHMWGDRVLCSQAAGTISNKEYSWCYVGVCIKRTCFAVCIYWEAWSSPRFTSSPLARAVSRISHLPPHQRQVTRLLGNRSLKEEGKKMSAAGGVGTCCVSCWNTTYNKEREYSQDRRPIIKSSE